jgi:hypothetical protein
MSGSPLFPLLKRFEERWNDMNHSDLEPNLELLNGAHL